MKKIAFFVQHMLCGGVENALISLTERLAEQGNDITIFVIKNKGEFMRKIPKSVSWRTISMEETIRDRIPVGGIKINIRECIKNGNYIMAGKFASANLSNRNRFAELSVPLNKIPILDETFDIAVNFHMHSPFLVWYLSERVIAKRKISWIHNDFSTTSYDIAQLKKYLDSCQEFYGVSRKLVDEFTGIFPEYKDKTQVMYNIVPVDEIIAKADGEASEYCDLPEKTIKILSVGRLEEQKGYFITIDVCKLLKEKGYKIKWIILGEGTERSKLENAAKKAGVFKELNFIGIKMNPYPYFRNCDIYVQTSLHEGYVTTVTEASIFQKPIVCTDVSGAKEQVENGVNGYVAGFEPEDIAEKIEMVIINGINKSRINVVARLQNNEEKLLNIFK